MHNTDRSDKYWNEAILEVINFCGSSEISLQEIYAQMRKNPLVKSYHLQPWRPGLQPRYECWIRRCLTDLVRMRRVRRVGRGKYASTAKR